MKAGVLTAPYQLEVREVPKPVAGPGEVVIKVKYMGICGSDLPIYEGKVPVEYPRILGHEFTGVIDELGEGVEGLAVGQPVMAQAAWMKDGVRMLLGNNVDGALAEYIKMPVSTVIPLPEELDLRLAQSLDSLSCCVNAVEKLNPHIGDVGLLFGTGHSGLLMEQVLKSTAISKLMVIGGRRRFRMEIAEKLGADVVIGSSDPEFDNVMKEFLPEQGADFVVEASGSMKALKQAADLVKPGGTILTYGLYKDKENDFDFSLLYKKEISITGVRGAGDCDHQAIRLLDSGKIDIDTLVTHDLTLDDCNEGFRMMAEREEKALRIVFSMEA